MEGDESDQSCDQEKAGMYVCMLICVSEVNACRDSKIAKQT